MGWQLCQSNNQCQIVENPPRLQMISGMWHIDILLIMLGITWQADHFSTHSLCPSLPDRRSGLYQAGRTSEGWSRRWHFRHCPSVGRSAHQWVPTCRFFPRRLSYVVRHAWLRPCSPEGKEAEAGSGQATLQLAAGTAERSPAMEWWHHAAVLSRAVRRLSRRQVGGRRGPVMNPG